MEPLRVELETMCLRTPELRASVLGDECVAIGAVCHGVEHLAKVLFDPEIDLSVAGPPSSLMV
ncbi:hypothetical protein ACNF49_15455 [Actinomadura sp. ATCC 39365]